MKKALSLVLALMMVISIMPMVSSAATVTTTNSNYFTVAQIATAASTLKTSVETNKKLPDTIKIGTYYTATPTFLRMMAAAICNISDGDTTTNVYSKSVATAQNPVDDVTEGKMYKDTYIKLANAVYNYIATNSQAANYYTISEFGKVSHENATYSLARVLAYYKTNGALPNYITFQKWSTITASASTTTDSTSFTIAEIGAAASTLKTSVETNKKLPSTVKVGAYNADTFAFIRMLAVAVVNINGGDTTSKINSKSVAAAQNPLDDVTTEGKMYKDTFVKLANAVITYVTANSRAANYYTVTGFGKVSHENATYSLARVMAYYNTNKALPNYITFQKWSTITGSASTSTGTTTETTVTTTDYHYFTIAEIGAAASTLKTSVETNKKLPATIKIGSYTTATPTFLKMMAVAVRNINNGNTTTKINSKAVAVAQNPVDEVTAGQMYKESYVKLANAVITYIDANNTSANYYTITDFGKVGYENATYSLARVMAYYNTNKALPNYITFQKWSTITAAFTLAQVTAAAATLKTYIESNKKLPDTITVGTAKLTPASFLAVMTKATIDLGAGTKTGAYENKTYSTASSPADSAKSANFQLSEYVSVAKTIYDYMVANGKAINYVDTTNCGRLGFQNLVYRYARVLAYYKTNNALPNYVAVTAWSSVTSTSSSSSSSSSSGIEKCPSGYEKYTVATTNCQVNNSTIQSVSKTARGSATTQYNMAFNIYNYLQANTSYWYFYYNTKLGALATWNKRMGNCCDLSHMLVAVWRASGVPARYYHAQITSSSGGRYGHVWAQCYISGKWYHGDLSNNVNTLRTSLPQTCAVVRSFNGTYITLPF